MIIGGTRIPMNDCWYKGEHPKFEGFRWASGFRFQLLAPYKRENFSARIPCRVVSGHCLLFERLWVFFFGR